MTLGFPLRQSYQDLVRLRHIAQVLIRNGLGFLIEQLGLARVLTPLRRGALEADQGMTRLSIPERVRHTLEDLGPTYVKLGQLMSTRPDVLPSAYIGELSKLLDSVPPFDPEIARSRVEKELGKPIDDLFASFASEPVASASIGQVHKATLHDGTRVVVKVQRPDIRRTIETDLNLLLRQARFLEARSSILREYQLVGIIEEFGQSLQDELDYVREGRNAERVAQVLSGLPQVSIPRIYWEFSTPQVITMEDVQGTQLNDLRLEERHGPGADSGTAGPGAADPGANASPGAVAELIATAYYHQIFAAGIFHADPHPANIIVHGSTISLVDFGLVGFISEAIKEDLGDLFIALMAQDVEQITDAIVRMGAVGTPGALAPLQRDVQRLLHRYYGVTLESISVSEFLKEITQVAFAHRIRLPSDLALLARTMIILEGVILSLDPDFNLVEFARPFLSRMLRQRMSPKRWGGDALRTARAFGRFFVSLPKRSTALMDQLETGEMTVGIEVRRLGQVMRRLDAIANRLVFSVIVASLIIGSSLVIQAGGDSLVWHVPLVGWGIPVAQITFLTAGILGAWLLISMLRSKGL